MKYSFLIILAVATLAACSSNNSKTEKAQNVAVNERLWELKFESYAAAEDSCPGMDCTFIEVSVPQLLGGNEAAREKMNAHVDAIIREQLKAQLPEPLGNASYQELCESFVDGFELFQMEFPDSEQTWSYLMSSQTSVLGADFFTLFLTMESYLGGAHPNTQLIAKSFDLESGEEIDAASRYDDQQLRMLAEQYFRAYHNMDANTPLNDGGFLFEDGEFTLPENIALSDSGLVLVYNTYEVASYAEGGTTFILPFDVLAEK